MIKETYVSDVHWACLGYPGDRMDHTCQQSINNGLLGKYITQTNLSDINNIIDMVADKLHVFMHFYIL